VLSRWQRVRTGIRAATARVRGAARVLASGGLYDSAGSGYRVRGWHAPSTGPTAAIVAAGDVLRNRSRAEQRNNGWAGNVSNVLVTNISGTGFTPHPLFGSEETREPARRSAEWARMAKHKFRRWAKKANADGGCFEAAFDVGIRGMVDAGDAFIVRVDGESAGVPLQLRVLEAEMVPLWKHADLGNGRVIRAGIEYQGATPVAYHMHRFHPGEFTLGLTGVGEDLVRVPADQVLHLFWQRRAGQGRGEPWSAAALLRLHDVGGYFDAECVRKKSAANFVFKVEAPDPDKVSAAIGELHDKAAATGEVDTVPGSTVVLGVGEEFDVVSPADVGPNFDPFVSWTLREISAGGSVPYSLATGDMSQETYTSHRAALLQFFRRCDAVQFNIIVPLLNRMWEWWLDAAVLSGAVSAPHYVPWREDYLDVEWVPSGRDWIDPAKEAKAKAEELRLGITSRTRICASRGEDFTDIARERAEEQRLLRELGLDDVADDLVRSSQPKRSAAAPVSDEEADDADEVPRPRRSGTDG
jgi:lambda family phage portal protein